jgi:large subunit ribosomal protein L23
MALFDFLKRKEKAEKAKETKEKKTEKKLADKPARLNAEALGGEKPDKSAKRILTGKGFSYEIIKEPHISEKATNLSEKDQYIFKIQKGANKTEVKKAVEGIYGVDVLSVNIVKIPEKKRRMGKTQGFKTGHTKAIVKIREGQKIEIL